MDMILVKSIFQNRFPKFKQHLLLVHIGIARGNSNVPLQQMFIK